MREGTSLKEHPDELSFVLIKLCDIDVKIEDEDLTMIMLAFLPPSFENFLSSLSFTTQSITLEEVKSSLYSRELQLKVFGNGGEAFASRLSMTNSAKGRKKKKGKGNKKRKIGPKGIYNYCKEPGL